MAITSQEIESVKLKLERMDTAEIKQVIQYLHAITAKRQEQRKKELWGNVRAALRKYVDETEEDIEIRHPYSDGILCVDELDESGLLYIAAE